MAADKFGNLTGLPQGAAIEPSTLRLSAAGETTYNSDDVTVPAGARGLVLNIHATDAANSPSVVFTLQGKDPVSGVYYTLLASAAVTTASPTHTRLLIAPTLTPVANVRAQDLLPSVIRVAQVHAAGATKSLTYSIAATFTP